MVRLVSSLHALRALVALSQRSSGARASDLARFLDTTPSAAHRAADILVDDRLATLEGREIRLTDTPATDAARRYAMAVLEPTDTAKLMAGANEVVEFAGHDDRGILFVVRRFAPLDGTHRLRAVLAMLRDMQPRARLEVLDKSDVRHRLLTDRTLRRRAQEMAVLAGSVDRTFPDRSRHGDVSLPPAGAIHPDLPHISQARLRGLARRYRLSRIALFGSAVRRDFRPDSDVDVLVTPRPATHLGLSERVALNYELEGLLARDVDLMTRFPSRTRHPAERAVVALYD